MSISPGSHVTFRPVVRADFPMLARWLAQPHVARWWNQDHDPAALERDFGPVIDGAEPAEALVVQADGTPIGLVERCRLVDYSEYVDELDPVVGPVPDTAWSIDYLLGSTDLIGRGIGPAVIAAASADTFGRHDDAHCLIVPVVAANTRSWRALEKAGFRIVASGELTPDNPIDSRAHHILRLDRPTAVMAHHPM